MKKTIHQDVYIGLVCFALCIGIFFQNRGLAGGAGSMPLILDGLLTALSAVIFIRGLSKSKLPEDQQGKKAFTLDAIKIPFIFWLFVAGYVILFRLVGYFLSTAVMMIVMMVFMKRRDWKIMILIDVIYLLAMYFVFVRMLSVNVSDFGMLGNLF